MMNTPNHQENLMEQPLKKEHARFGIASFVFFLILTCPLMLVVVWSFMEIKRGGGEGVVIFLPVFLSNIILYYICPIILGIVGLFEEQRRKLFPALTVILSIAIILGIIVTLAYA